MRALPPIHDLSTFFPVTPIVLDLTIASKLTNYQFPNSKKIPHTQPLATLGNGSQIRDPPIEIEGSVEDGGTWVH